MAKKKKSKSKPIIITVVVLGALAALYMVVFVDPRAKAQEVTTEKVSRRSVTQTVSAIGKIHPETEVKISSEASGEIIFLGAKDGDSVKAGKLLVKIQPDLIQTQVQQSSAASDMSRIQIETIRAELTRADADYKRIVELYGKQFATREELDRSKAQLDQASTRLQSATADYSRSLAMLRQTKVSASRTTIYAPMSGTVTSLSVEAGEKVVGTAQMQGTEMMRIADLSVMNARVDVDENDVVMVNIGDTARVRVEAFSDKVFTGIVYEIGHSAKINRLGTQEEVTNFEVRIRILDPDAKLRPGMSCNVDIETETHTNVLAVPLQAVTVRQQDMKMVSDVTEGGIQKTSAEEAKPGAIKRPPSVVFVNENGAAKMIVVETGISDQGYIEIKKGLAEKQEVIVGAFEVVNKKLQDGMAIAVDTSDQRNKFRKNQ